MNTPNTPNNVPTIIDNGDGTRIVPTCTWGGDCGESATHIIRSLYVRPDGTSFGSNATPEAVCAKHAEMSLRPPTHEQDMLVTAANGVRTRTLPSLSDGCVGVYVCTTIPVTHRENDTSDEQDDDNEQEAA